VKLYERAAGKPFRAIQVPPRVSAGEVFLVLGLLALVGIVVGVGAHQRANRQKKEINVRHRRTRILFDLDAASKARPVQRGRINRSRNPTETSPCAPGDSSENPRIRHGQNSFVERIGR